MNIPAMCTGEMKYVILRIDTHVLRIDLCPRKRTRIRRQKQDEDVHLFLSERKKARPQLRQGPSLTTSAEAGKLLPGTRPNFAGVRRRPGESLVCWGLAALLVCCGYPCRGVLNTPHRAPPSVANTRPRGMVIHPLRDVWWGVCNTPLHVPGKLGWRP